jgi:hypothetical protein
VRLDDFPIPHTATANTTAEKLKKKVYPNSGLRKFGGFQFLIWRRYQ